MFNGLKIRLGGLRFSLLLAGLVAVLLFQNCDLKSGFKKPIGERSSFHNSPTDVGNPIARFLNLCKLGIGPMMGVPCKFEGYQTGGPRALSYGRTWIVAALGRPLRTLVPQVEGHQIRFSIQPDLPSGLAFDTHTGIISGTPTQTKNPGENYKVTAYNDFGSVGILLNLRVLAPLVVNSLEDSRSDRVFGDSLCASELGSGVCTLRAALLEANEDYHRDWVVVVPEGTYFLSATLGPLKFGYNETGPEGDAIIGEGPGEVVVDGQNATPLINGNWARRIHISDMTFQNGQAGWRNSNNEIFPLTGGIFASTNNHPAIFRFSNLKFFNNRAYDRPTSEGPRGSGGALYLGGGGPCKVDIEYTLFEGNFGPGGGGAAVINSNNSPEDEFRIRYSEFRSNWTDDDQSGGGLVVNNDGYVEIESCSFSENRSAGATVDFFYGTMNAVVRNSTFFENEANWGSAIGFSSDDGSIYIYNSSFVGNTATAGPSVLYSASSRVSQFFVANSIFAGNVSPPSGGYCRLNSSSITSLGGNVFDNSGVLCGAGESDLTNRSTSELDFRDYGDHGGVVSTLEIGPSSVARGAALFENCTNTDARFVLRSKINGVGQAACDAGAFESPQ